MNAGLPDPREALQKALGHRFRELGLLDQALTHRSYGACNNERLEFLGDSILNFVIAAELYRLRPDDAEGDLSRVRATLVRGVTLAEVARELDLGQGIRLGGGEMKSGGHRRESILADAVEAILGAIYRDAGFDRAREVILHLWRARLRDLPSAESLKDPKTRLQEWLQSRNRPLPEYETTYTGGADHNRNLVVVCRAPGLDEPVEGRGASRRKAEQAAARKALEKIHADGGRAEK